MNILRVIICTYNPNIEKLLLCFASIKNQSSMVKIEVIVVINGTTFELEEKIVKLCTQFEYICVITSVGNLSNARKLGLEYPKSQDSNYKYLFVDDDNYLHPNYITNGMTFMMENNEVGVLGGKSIVNSELKVGRNSWALKYLAIKDLGEAEVRGVLPTWEECDPHGAGMFINQPVADLYCETFRNTKLISTLGRAGKSLNSGEDTFVCILAKKNGYQTAYIPTLKLTHHISPERLKLGYLYNLAKGMGHSDHTLETVLSTGSEKHSKKRIIAQIEDIVYFMSRYSIGEAIFQMVRSRSRRISNEKHI